MPGSEDIVLTLWAVLPFSTLKERQHKESVLRRVLEKHFDQTRPFRLTRTVCKPKSSATPRQFSYFFLEESTDFGRDSDDISGSLNPVRAVAGGVELSGSKECLIRTEHKFFFFAENAHSLSNDQSINSFLGYLGYSAQHHLRYTLSGVEWNQCRSYNGITVKLQSKTDETGALIIEVNLRIPTELHSGSSSGSESKRNQQFNSSHLTSLDDTKMTSSMIGTGDMIDSDAGNSSSERSDKSASKRDSIATSAILREQSITEGNRKMVGFVNDVFNESVAMRKLGLLFFKVKPSFLG